MFTKSENQITLGQFIKQLEKLPQDITICYEFYLMPCGDFDSYRGYYSDLALSVEPESGETVLVADLLKMAKDCLGKTFEGYKGGDFTMDENTPLWVANYSECSSTAITGIKFVGETPYMALIQTEYVD